MGSCRKTGLTFIINITEKKNVDFFIEENSKW